MKRYLLWVVGGLALLGYFALSFGVFGGSSPEIPELSPVVVGAGTPAASPSGTGKSTSPTPTRGPSPTPLPPGVIASQGDTFVLANAGVVTGGTKVMLTGQGFNPGEALELTLRGDGLAQDRAVGTGFANKDGFLENVGFDVPTDLPPGRYIVLVSAPKSGKSAQASFELSGGSPGVEPDVYAAKPGTTVKFTGAGFQPGEKITVYFDSMDSTPLGTLTASASGTIRAAGVPVPLTAEGPHAFVFVGDQSKMPVRVPLAVTGLYPFITLDNYTPLPQQAVGVGGEDFYPGERVLIYLNQVGNTPLAVVTAGEKGAINAAGAVPIPVDMRGPATVIARGEQSGLQTSADLTISEFAPALELTVYNGSPGTSVAFTGSAFAADETVHVYDGKPEDKKELAKFTTGPNGTFKAVGAFQIPLDMKPGKVTLTAVGEKSQVPVSVVFAVQDFQPGLNMTSYAGKAGDTTSFTGSGFVPGETLNVFIGKSESGQKVSSIKVGPDGGFKDAGAFVVPYGTAPGQLALTVVGDQSKSPQSIEYTVLPFTPWVGLDSYAGPVGSQVRFVGGSFAPGEIVDVHLGDAKGKVVLSVTADDEGKFPLSDPYTIPESGGDASFVLVGETSGAQVTVKYKVTREGAPGGAPANEQPKPTGTSVGTPAAAPKPTSGQAGQAPTSGATAPAPTPGATPKPTTATTPAVPTAGPGAPAPTPTAR